MLNYMCANWKMFKTRQQAAQTTSDLVTYLASSSLAGVEVVIFPPFTALETVHQILDSRPGFCLGAQNVYPAAEGAYTGEISPAMLTDHGCSYVLAGHSERRHVLVENNDFVARKVDFALQNNLKVILCIGETLQERKENRLQSVLAEQLQSALQDLQTEKIQDKLLIAYEPVWAIGTGEVARVQDIAQAHQIVRDMLQTILADFAWQIPILYGGSVKPDNSPEIMAIDNVNGLLVGGASLNADAFSQIVHSGSKA